MGALSRTLAPGEHKRWIDNTDCYAAVRRRGNWGEQKFKLAYLDLFGYGPAQPRNSRGGAAGEE
jgi:hypothetical protein